MNSNVSGSGVEEDVKKNIAIFAYKQRILSIEMKTKLVQHVPRINLSHFNFQLGTSSMNSKVTGEGAEVEVKKALQISPINSDF